MARCVLLLAALVACARATHAARMLQAPSGPSTAPEWAGTVVAQGLQNAVLFNRQIGKSIANGLASLPSISLPTISLPNFGVLSGRPVLSLPGFPGVRTSLSSSNGSGDGSDSSGDDGSDVAAPDLEVVLEPELEVHPNLGLTPLDLAPTLSSAVTPLDLTVAGEVGLQGEFNPSATHSGTATYEAGSTSTTVTESPVSTTVTASNGAAQAALAVLKNAVGKATAVARP